MVRSTYGVIVAVVLSGLRSSRPAASPVGAGWGVVQTQLRDPTQAQGLGRRGLGHTAVGVRAIQIKGRLGKWGNRQGQREKVVLLGGVVTHFCRAWT